MNLERAIVIATEGHARQFDKAGAPYILHPIRVMQAQQTEEGRIVGVLHDVVEGCPGWTFERPEAEGFSAALIEALRLVTKIKGEDYEDCVRRAGSNPISCAEKIADLRNNKDLTRLGQITAKEMEHIEKYRRTLGILGA